MYSVDWRFHPYYALPPVLHEYDWRRKMTRVTVDKEFLEKMIRRVVVYLACCECFFEGKCHRVFVNRKYCRKMFRDALKIEEVKDGDTS